MFAGLGKCVLSVRHAHNALFRLLVVSAVCVDPEGFFEVEQTLGSDEAPLNYLQLGGGHVEL
jgi:hypothetical protein